MKNHNKIFAAIVALSAIASFGQSFAASNVAQQPSQIIGVLKNSTQPNHEISAASSGLVVQTHTLTSIKQVLYTDHSGETWIEVNGTGTCNYVIEGAGITSSFASTAAKPFPMKVKIVNAPLGGHIWNAKGTGNCTGTAQANFSVD